MSTEEGIDAFQFKAVELGFSISKFNELGVGALMVVGSLDKAADLIEQGWGVIEQRNGKYLLGLKTPNKD